jgi:hypothetical protein
MLSPLYGQLSPLRIPTSSRFISADADVSSYILAVESADGEQLEEGVISAVENFVVGCKSDGIWNALKASCILAGARTLSGALVPLAGTAPTNFNFVSGDYNRKTGLKGNASTKYLRHSVGTINSNQLSYGFWLTSDRTTSQSYLGPTELHRISGQTNAARVRPGVTTFTQMGSSNTMPGLIGVNLQTNEFIWRCLGQSNSVVKTSTGQITTPFFVYGTNVNGTPNSLCASRFSLYFVGENLTLALLDSRVSTLMTALAAAIP